ncbi:hypothetical protein N9L02_00505 [Gammaproteobacteria bacterium]|nr:hypothetical protein [Gammaproteobacteria bacterium]
MRFPRVILSNNKIYNKIDSTVNISGLNFKSFYQDEDGILYIVKIEKERSIQEIFSGISNLEGKQEYYIAHLDSLRDQATVTSVIALNIAKEIFLNFRFPDNYLCRLDDFTPIVLSTMIPKNENFQEFLKENKILKGLPFDNQKVFKKESLGLFNTNDFNKEQAHILGKIYYVALFMGHWDIVNNLDLSNSGSVMINNKLIPCIVDWGNCLWGFGGVDQDSTAFKNPEFWVDVQSYASCSIYGFKGCVPFDNIVYPRLPRQLVSNLFDLTGEDEVSKIILAGFIETHNEAKSKFSSDKIMSAIKKTLAEEQSLFSKSTFRKALNKELFLKNKNGTLGLSNILQNRLLSLDEIIYEISLGTKMTEISQIQFQKIKSSQVY